MAEPLVKPASGGGSVVISGGTVLLPAGVRRSASVLVRAGKIESILDDYSPVDGDTVVNAKGLFVSPGFVDPHTHVSLFEDGFGDYGCNENSGPVTPYLRASDGVNHLDRGFREALTSGVTTVCVTPGSNNVISGQAVALKTSPGTVPERTVRDCCALKVALGDNPLATYGRRATPAMPGTRMAIAYMLRKNLLEANEYSRKRSAGTVPRDLGMEAIERVLRGDSILKVHCHQANDIVTACRIAEEFGIERVSLDHCTEAHLVVDFLAARFRHFLYVQGPVTVFRGKPELRHRDPASVKILHQKGLSVALCTDHPIVPVQFFLDQANTIAHRTGLSPTDLLPMLTENSARAIGLQDRLGRIAPGFDADFALLTAPPGDPTAFVRHTIVDGIVAWSSSPQ